MSFANLRPRGRQALAGWHDINSVICLIEDLISMQLDVAAGARAGTVTKAATSSSGLEFKLHPVSFEGDLACAWKLTALARCHQG
jgi:hypothetical protein